MQKFLKIILWIVLLVFILFGVSNYLFPLNKSLSTRPSSRIIYSTKGEVLHMELSRDGFFRMNKGLDDIPKDFVSYLLQFEDKYFYSHFGLNPLSIVRAIIYNLTSNNRIGASTITMQLARMQEKRNRSYWSKMVECFRAVQLELNFSKTEILSRYLNIAPYGGNIEGIHAAALLYFDKSISNLSLSEFAYLMILPKNPEVYRPKKSMSRAISRRNMFYLSLLKKHEISGERFDHLVSEKILARRRPRKSLLPHYSRFLKNKVIVHSTIDMQLQIELEHKLQDTVSKNTNLGVRNGACVVYDLQQKDFIIWIGSQDFNNKNSLGENDGILAKRSPGSLLKPFIYAKALDEGLISPKQLILDMPMHFGEYSPQNFDKKFYGLVRVEEALNLSLNIPAIDLNMSLHDDLYELLNTSLPKGLKQNAKFYGQGLVLGGVGLSLLDLIKLYSMFPNKGRVIGNKNSVISEASSTLINQILKKNFRLDLSSYWESKKNASAYAFKTGTSAQRRDLWTIGYNQRFIVGVWYGDFKGLKTKRSSGLSIASSTLEYAMNRLTQNYGDQPLISDATILSKKTCQDSIFRDQDNCNDEVEDYWVPNTNSESQCKLLSLEKIRYLNQHGLGTSITSSKCLPKLGEMKPKIISPLNKTTVVLSKSIPLKYQKIKLHCISIKDQSKVRWFLNEKLIRTSLSGEISFYGLKEGNHEISCIDENSMWSKIEVKVVK